MGETKPKSDLAGIKVLLLEGFSRQVMPMMQALHDLGCHLTTYNQSRLDMGFASRYPDRRFLGFWDRSDERKTYFALLELLRSERFDVVIPLTDFSATMLSRNKEELRQYTNAAVNDWDVFQSASDKQRTMEACRINGVPHPRTLVDVVNVEDVIVGGLQYPIVIKPRTGYGSIGFHRVEDEAQLRAKFSEAANKNGRMLAQEYIPQTDIQYKCEVFLDGNGEVKSAVVFDKTRWYPIDGGSTCCSASVIRPDIVDSSVKLLKAIGWRGYGDVDLIQDPRDGIAKVMEINPRITASVKVCFAAGVDFARQIVEFETGRQVTGYLDYQADCRLRYMHTDLLWFIESPDRWRAKPSWFSWKRTTDQIWSWRDPWPWFTYTVQGFAKVGKEKKKRER